MTTLSLFVPTLRENSTYHAKEWIKNNDNVWFVGRKENVYQRIKKLSELLRFLEVLFIIEDIIANKSLYKRRQTLLELSISAGHRGHYLWLLTVLLCHTKKFKKTSEDHICVVSKRKGRS